MDYLYVVKRNEHNDQLKYSLRALHQYVKPKRVWIAGYVPSWVKNVHCFRIKQCPSWPSPVSDILRHVVHHDKCPKQFVFMNDDFFPTKPVTVNSIPLVSNNKLIDLLENHNWKRGTLRRQVECTINRLNHEYPGTIRDSWLSFDMVHRPLPVHRDIMRIALSDVEGSPLLHRSMYGNTFVKLYGDRSVNMVDAKIRHYSARVPTAADFSWISTSSSSWQGVAGELIRNIHDTSSPYEK